MSNNTGKEALLSYLRSETDDYARSEGLMMSGLFISDESDLRTLVVPYCERPILNSGYDVFGVHWTRANPAAHYTPGQKPILTNIEKWKEQVPIPDVSKLPWNLLEDMAAQVDRSKKAVVITSVSGPFERATMLSSFEDSLVNAITDPENFKDLIDALADYKIEIIQHIAKYAQPDIINLHDDWGTSKALFISPALWREVVKPATQRLYDAVLDEGIIIAQHSCGRLVDVVEDMVEMGADVWEAQSDVQDLFEIEKRYAGKLRVIHSPVGDDLIPPGYDPDNAPDPEKLPPNMRPYKEPPAHLWR